MNSSDSNLNKASLTLQQGMRRFIAQEKLFQPTEHIVLAVSGGVDSMVMAHLFKTLNYHFTIAHVNFQLRAEASDKDEELVKQWASQRKIPCYTQKFDTEACAQAQGLSIQLAARTLRYEWFEKIRTQCQAHYIATAHHLNDSLETSVFHLAKGGGIKGLAGIPAQAERIIRPLLFASREQVLEYAQSNNVPWREDASNATDKYRRNFIRHHITPLLREINPSLEQTASYTFDRLRQTKALADFYLKELSKDVLAGQEGSLPCIRIARLLQTPAPTLLLHELISPYGFNYVQSQGIIELLESPKGQLFLSNTHQIYIEKDIIRVLPADISIDNTPNKWGLGTSPLSLPSGKLMWARKEWKPQPFPKNACQAWFDASLLEQKLEVRKCQQGDRIKPFGMKGSKLISDILNELQVPNYQRAEALVLCANGEVLWLLGYRISRLFKITPSTQSMVAFEWEAVGV